MRGTPGRALLTTVLFKIITRMKSLFSNYLGDYSYSCKGSSEKNFFALQLQFPGFFFLTECSYNKLFPSGFLKNFLPLQLHDLMVFRT